MEPGKEKYDEIEKRLKKAATPDERMPKQKHVRWCILSVYDLGTSEPFWSVIKAFRGDTVHPVALYKMLFVVHKMVVDGPAPIVQEAIFERGFIADTAKNLPWSDYTGPVDNYVVYLGEKLAFHKQHTAFAGNFDYEDYVSLRGASNLAAGFVLVEDLVGYYSVIEEFYQNLFAIERMTEALLAPLLPLVEEAFGLYTFVKSMLTAMFVSIEDPSSLDPLEKKFCSLFGKLKAFYRSCDSLQVIRHLLTLPEIGEKPVSFLEIREDFFKVEEAPQVQPTQALPYVGENRLERDLDEAENKTAERTMKLQGDVGESRLSGDIDPDLFKMPSLDDSPPRRPAPIRTSTKNDQWMPRAAPECREHVQRISFLESELEKETSVRKRLVVLCMEQKDRLEKFAQRIGKLKKEHGDSAMFEKKTYQKLEGALKRVEEAREAERTEKRRNEKLARAYRELRAEYVECAGSKNEKEVEELEERLELEKTRRQRQQEKFLDEKELAENALHSLQKDLAEKDTRIEELEKQASTEKFREDNKMEVLADEMKDLLVDFDDRKRKYYEGLEDAFGELFRTTPGLIDRMGGIASLLVQLVQTAVEEQREIVQAGHGTGDPSQFYKKYHRWKEGLVSAAKQIVQDSSRLLGLAGRDEAPEKTIVGCTRLTASISQLLTAARVKADTSGKTHLRLEELAARVQTMASELSGNVRQQTTAVPADLDAFEKMTETEFTRRLYELKEETEQLDSELVRKREEISRMNRYGYHQEEDAV
ncbi:MAG: cytoskeleton assembly control protein Sla2 [Amphiamblys sp. WSBS2006]|nr:MAG: cytoskeleton assembly control protein Sla2 [Amphiamblys sp. WSBS2006]